MRAGCAGGIVDEQRAPDPSPNREPDAFDVGREYDSERVIRAVAMFRNSLGMRAGRATAELDERLHATYREGS
jgi:hypothetical protein